MSKKDAKWQGRDLSTSWYEYELSEGTEHRLSYTICLLASVPKRIQLLAAGQEQSNSHQLLPDVERNTRTADGVKCIGIGNGEYATFLWFHVLLTLRVRGDGIHGGGCSRNKAPWSHLLWKHRPSCAAEPQMQSCHQSRCMTVAGRKLLTAPRPPTSPWEGAPVPAAPPQPPQSASR